MKKISWWFFTVVFLLVLSPVSFAANESAPQSIAGAVTIDLVDTKAFYLYGAAFIDIRSDYQFGNRHIPGSINLPLDDMFNETNLLRYVQKETPFLIYGNGSHRGQAAEAVKQAVSWGFTQVHYFRGGIKAWRRDGSPLKTRDE